MNPRQFLIIGETLALKAANLGFVGIAGPTAAQSIFGGAWWFDNYEDWAHLILGVVAILACFAFPASLPKPLVVIVGIVGLFFAVYNIFAVNFFGAMLQQPLDLILHAVVGAWALLAAKGDSGSMM